MSLINEALKRTRDASFQAGNARPGGVGSYRVSSGVDSSLNRSGLWVSLFVVVMAGVVVTLFALRVTRPGRQVHDALVSTDLDSQPVPAGPASTFVVRPVIAPVATPSKSVPADEAAVPAVAAPVVPVAEAVTAPEVPKFTLQGITTAATWREAMINGYTVREGDEVDGVKIIAIEARHVKLQFGEREIVLRMP